MWFSSLSNDMSCNLTWPCFFRFWIAAMSGDSASMPSMPEDLVTGLFDQYADKFDEHLVSSLQYRTPQLLMDTLLDVASSVLCCVQGCNLNSSRWQRAADLGCGTGLMGPLLRRHVAHLEGADLSAGMVNKARGKGCYDRLVLPIKRADF
jgi:predicted TPR repeat methyltransferase